MLTSGECPDIVVSNADFAKCNGLYSLEPSLHVSWAPQTPVFKHESKNRSVGRRLEKTFILAPPNTIIIARLIFWNANGVGWSIGKAEFLKTGAYWHNSGTNSSDWPTLASPWTKGVTVTCLQSESISERQQSSDNGENRRISNCLMDHEHNFNFFGRF